MPDYDISSGTSNTWNTSSGGWTTTLAAGGKNFFKGYDDSTAVSTSIPTTFFVPLTPGARPHLVSATAFQNAKDPATPTNKAAADSFAWSIVCVATWFGWTPSSGYQNLLGVVNMGAVNTDCCPNVTNASQITINYSSSGDTVNLPAGCPCETTSPAGCHQGGPC